MRMTMDEKLKIAINYMRGQNGRFISPTTIGAIINGGHSAVGSPVCKEMVKRGLAERSEKGHYRLIEV